MKKITKEDRLVGSLELFEDESRRFFLARPHGMINPSLLKTDVESARRFANKVNAPWTYITNTEDVNIVNPFNLLYLKEVKKIKNLKRIVVYAPHLAHRVLLRMVKKIVQYDLLITEKHEFEKLISTVK
jgi:hypothetical protein